MDFELSADETALAQAVRTLCEARFALDSLQKVAGTERDCEEAALDSGGWASLAEAGVFSLQVPESRGGVGLGMGAASVVFEELGRALVPGPLLASHLAARDLEDFAEGVADGSTVVGSLRIDASLPRGPVPLLVADLSSLDALVVVENERLLLARPDELDAVMVGRSLDPLTPLWRLVSEPKGEIVGDAAAARRWLRDESVLLGALLVGIAARCVELAVDYAKSREQFGRPIGSFQAIKHICADMLVRSEVARVAVQAAAVTVDQPEVGDPERAAAGAALIASEAALSNAKACIQVHGGMGFTWEIPAHLFLMRARVLSRGLGSFAGLAETVAERYQ